MTDQKLDYNFLNYTKNQKTSKRTSRFFNIYKEKYNFLILNLKNNW